MTTADGSWDEAALVAHLHERLVGAWDSDVAGTVHLDEDHYIQWALSWDGLQLEVASNASLPPPAQLTFTQRRTLRLQGWADPVGPDLPNYWRCFPDRRDAMVAASCLAGVVRLLAPQLIKDAPPVIVASSRTPLPVQRDIDLTAALIAPCLKVDPGVVSQAVRAVLQSIADAGARAAVIDLYGGCWTDQKDDLDLELVEDASAALASEAPVVLLRQCLDQGDLYGLLCRVVALVDECGELSTAGRTVVIVGPPIHSGGRYLWLYAGLARDLTSHIVVCADENYSEDIHGTGLLQLARANPHDGPLPLAIVTSRKPMSTLWTSGPALASADVLAHLEGESEHCLPAGPHALKVALGHFLGIYRLPNSTEITPANADECRAILDSRLAPTLERYRRPWPPVTDDADAAEVTRREDRIRDFEAAARLLRRFPQAGVKACRPFLLDLIASWYLMPLDDTDLLVLTPGQRSRLSLAYVELAARLEVGADTVLGEAFRQSLAALTWRLAPGPEERARLSDLASIGGDGVELAVLRALNAPTVAGAEEIS